MCDLTVGWWIVDIISFQKMYGLYGLKHHIMKIRDNYLYQIHWIFGKLPNGGGGVISDLKNYVANFSIKKEHFGAVKTMNFRKKGGGGHANPNEFRCKFLDLPKKAQHCFPKIGWGGGSEAVWKFSENSVNLVGVIVPKWRWHKWRHKLTEKSLESGISSAWWGCAVLDQNLHKVHWPLRPGVHK